MCQIQLQLSSGLGVLQEFVRIFHLTSYHCHESISYAHQWEMTVVLLIVGLGPQQYRLDCVCEFEVAVFNQSLRVSRDVEPIDLPKQ